MQEQDGSSPPAYEDSTDKIAVVANIYPKVLSMVEGRSVGVGVGVGIGVSVGVGIGVGIGVGVGVGVGFGVSVDCLCKM
ncbi:uncharacterized protein N7482_001079 [Penicillium canariense]|uniref:Uncharacterized protein n=1 Tax=Penicillium canariense TaxID=189055 RepID=A0A9W9LTT1_9EURO|nr:uncharacterized protein N7482_001079 [Penicillium canariense]KAJ5175202.1 hypothetical protein N7482_001079 [Penicillium canariense]